MYITRRQLLKSSLALIPSSAFLPAAFQRAATQSTLKSNPITAISDRVLIVVQMAGGNDGLNTVIPFANGLYYDHRPNLAIPEDQVIPLNADVGLHPSLTEFKSLWDEGVLAIVEGVGYPNPNFSHFKSMDIWRTADPEGKLNDGWLGRYLETLNQTQEHVFQGLAVDRVLPRELSSQNVAIPIVESIAAYHFQSDSAYPGAAHERLQNLLKLYAASPPETPYAVHLNNTIDVAYQSTQALQKSNQAYKSAFEYPDNKFAKGLRLLAQAITGNLGIKVGHITLGGFDTHADQKDQHSRLLKILAEGIYAFYQDLKAHGRDREVVIMTWSEFGRRVKSNASDGTDHGSAGPLFIFGTPVDGGFYGQHPNLGQLDNDNLRFTTDFRIAYATVLEKWLGAPAEAVLGPNQFEKLPILTQA